MIIEKLGDKEWAKKLYIKAEEIAEEYSDHKKLADSIYGNLGDQEWANNILKKTKGTKISSDIDICPICEFEIFSKGSLAIQGEVTHGDRVDYSFEEKELNFSDKVNLL